MLEWTPVTSTCLDQIGFDAEILTLGCDFCYRGVYVYFNVPADIFMAFLAASSKGKYFDASIRNVGYSYQKIAP